LKSAIQFGQNTTLQAPHGAIELDASDDGDVQIQIVETALPLSNIRAGSDIIFKADGDIQILDRNVLHAGGSLTLIGTSSARL
jgi:hypothetical protein